MTPPGQVIWITGLSGSGKSTLAVRVARELRLSGQPVVYLDGDELREVLSQGHQADGVMDRDSRVSLAKQYAALCRLLANQGLTVVIATISMFHQVHSWNRANIPNYLEIFLRVPLEVLRDRDPKGIYKAFAQGKLSNVAGLDLKVDEPAHPDLVINNYETTTIADAEKALLKLVGVFRAGSPEAIERR